MELVSYFHILQRRKWIILITVIATAIVAITGHILIPVTYKTSAVLRIIPYSTANPSYNEIMYADRVLKTYLEIGSSESLLSKLREELNLPIDRPISTEVEIIADTELLRITVKDYDPILAADAANTLAAYLINDRTVRDVRTTLIEPAITPKPPSTLSKIALYVLIVLVGTSGGIGLAFVFENIDTHLYDEEQIKIIAGLSILCWIPAISNRHLPKIFADRFPYNHAFQRLSVVLQNMAQEKQLKTVLITSPERYEGKSTIAANLAVCFARSNCKTLLVDANIYHPTIHQYFGLTNKTGLYNLLRSKAAQKNAIQATNITELSIITSGSISEDFNEIAIDSRQFNNLIGQISNQYDFVILDAPAHLGMVESTILSSMADGVLVVVRPGLTQSLPLKTSCQQLEDIHANIIGIVLNGVSDTYSTKYSHSLAKRWYNPILGKRKGTSEVKSEKPEEI